MEVPEKCTVCNAAAPSVFCPCTETAVFLCPLCTPKHSSEHDHSQVLPLKAYGYHTSSGYLDRLRTRIRRKEQGEDELMTNLKLIGDCQKELISVVNKLTKKLTSFLNQNIAKLQKLKIELETNINEAVAEVESCIYQEEPVLNSSLGRALWSYTPGSLRLFTYHISQKTKMDLREVFRCTYNRSGATSEAEFLQEQQSFLDQHLHPEEEGVMGISDDEEVVGLQEGEEYTESPVEMLTQEARKVMMTVSDLVLREVEGVETMTARKLPDNSVYVGDWLRRPNGSLIQHGKGKLYTPDGGFNEGYWKAGALHITGRVIDPTGTWYEGDFVHGIREGVGSMQTLDPKTAYYGRWSMDKRNGYGKELLADGSVYEGNFIQDMRHGEGKLRLKNGNNYTGNFSNGVQNGVGVFRWTDGRMYEGEWRDGKMHGKGAFTYADGSTYEGEYVDDRKEGFGVYHWDGKVYEGPWKEGQMHGRGVITLENGTRTTYEFDMGKRIREVD